MPGITWDQCSLRWERSVFLICSPLCLCSLMLLFDLFVILFTDFLQGGSAALLA